MAGSKKLTGKHLEDAMKMLRALAELFDRHSLHYSLDAGTLLGVMRENRLLPWDTDMDLMIPSTQWQLLVSLRKAIHKAGYITRIRRTTIAVGPLAKGTPRLLRVYTRRWFFLKGEQLMDIFVKYKAGEKYFWTVDSRNPIVQSCPAASLDELTRHDFAGCSYNIPRDYDAYLTHHYGNWREVRKDWNFRREDRSNTSASEWIKANGADG